MGRDNIQEFVAGAETRPNVAQFVSDVAEDPEAVSTEGVEIKGKSPEEFALDPENLTADFTPILGSIRSANDLKDAIERGDVTDSVLASVGLIPFVGGVTKSMRGVLNRMEKFFTPGAIENIQTTMGPVSQDVIVEMTPKEFLSMARPVDVTTTGQLEPLKSVEKFDDVPFLYVDNVASNPIDMEVVGHEGRHRMFTLMQRHGEDVKIPVRVHHRSYWWGSHPIFSEHQIPENIRLMSETPFTEGAARTSMNLEKSRIIK